MLIVTNKESAKQEKYISNNKPEIRQTKILESLDNIRINYINSLTSVEFLNLIKTHDLDYLNFLRNAYESFKKGNPDIEFVSKDNGLIPIVFPTKLDYDSKQKINKLDAWKQVGYYCTDTSTPIREDTLNKVIMSANVAYTSAELLVNTTEQLIYALTLYPGHHAGKNFYGGYCYINNIALAAQRISELDNSKIVILDLDYHAGDGTFDIFSNSNITTISIHMDPKYDYPYYRGFEGIYGPHNNHYYLTLEPKADIIQYMEKLNIALNKIKEISPKYLLIAFGADTYENDPEISPNAGMTLDISDYAIIGNSISSVIKELNGKILVTQEGGYNMENVGLIVKTFLTTLYQ